MPQAWQHIRTVLAALCTASLVAALCPLSTLAAESGSISEAITAHDTVISTGQAYNAAQGEVDRLNTEIETLTTEIATIDEELPQEKAKCSASCVALYKYAPEIAILPAVLLSADSLDQAFAVLDYYYWIVQSDLDHINHLTELVTSRDEAEQQIADDQAALPQAQAAADEALQSAIQARQAVQQLGIEAQLAEAEAETHVAESGIEGVLITSVETEDTEGDTEDAIDQLSPSTEDQTDGATAKDDETEPIEVDLTLIDLNDPNSASAANIDWQMTKQEFVDIWAPRIDAYLADSPMAGCGTYYAQYAWDYGCDPRWAPAASLIESSKGLYCFKTYNAWGYGQTDFASWEEGIQNECQALGGTLYGSYLTFSATQTYCPPHWATWYNKAVAEMASI